jgi:putative DNA primase/helicase
MAPPALVVAGGGVMARSSIPPSAVGAPAWWSNLILNDKGAPRRLLENATIPFEQDPLFVDKFWFDKFQMKILVHGPLPWRQNPPSPLWEMDERDELQAWRWLERTGIPTDRKLTLHAISGAARANTFHPIIDYFNSITWDGTPRLDTWTVDYLGAEDGKLTRAMAACWMISAVARVFQPGCKADYALVLEGHQGDLRKGKSSVLQILGNPWYTDDISELGSKDAAEQTVGRWIIELSELDAMLRADPMRTKSFISRRVGRFRWSYDPAVREYPRECVFAGTTNEQNWSRDPTGNRRFWPMWCTHVKADELELVRDQLWAEARDRYFSGEHWWIDDQSLVVDAREAQEARYSEDPWEPIIEKELDEIVKSLRFYHPQTGNPIFEGRHAPSMQTLLGYVHIQLEKQSLREQIRIANIMRRLGWIRKRASLANGTRPWAYFPGRAVSETIVRSSLAPSPNVGFENRRW